MAQLQQYGQRLYEEAMQRFQGEHATMRREFDIFRSVLDAQRQNPDLDANQLLQQALTISQSNPQQLLELATKAVMNQDGRQTEAEARRQFEQWKSEYELEQQNKQLAAIQGQGAQTFRGMFPELDSGANYADAAKVQNDVVQKLLNDPDSGLTPAHFI